MCIPEEYIEINNMLEPVIKEYNLDEISVKSLVRSCIEIEEQPIQPATVVWKSKDGNSYSTKPSNIKVNLKFALSTVFRLKTVINQKDIWLILAILHLVVDLFTCSTTKIDELSGLTLLSVYRLQHADEERLFRYAKEICPKGKEEILQKADFNLSLARLEEWGCIKMEQGEYILNETVTSSMVKGIE